MRVGLVIYGNLDTLSGGYLYDRMLVRQLMLAGHAVELYRLSWRDYAKHLGDNLSRSWQRRLLHAHVDLMLQDELNHPSLVWINRRLRHRIRYPTVTIVHHLRSGENHPPRLLRLYRAVERLYLNGVDGYLCNSQTTLHSVQCLVAQAQPSHVAYPAADHLPYPAEPALAGQGHGHTFMPGPLRLVFVGNLIERKGLHTLLVALAKLPPDTWRLDVVGRLDVDRAYTTHIRQLAAHLGMERQVIFHGRLTDEALADRYRRNQVLAVPSYEGFGIVYLEAMRCGLPVLASTAGAAHEIVTHGLDGFLGPPGDAEALAANIRRLCEDRQLLLVMSYAARQRYQRHPTWAVSMGGAVDWLHTIRQHRDRT